MSIKEEILMSKGKNWARLVANRADQICKERQEEVDLMIQILSGEIYNQAVEDVANDIKAGKYDEMLMPIECNL